jgi:hypothetical protein
MAQWKINRANSDESAYFDGKQYHISVNTDTKKPLVKIELIVSIGELQTDFRNFKFEFRQSLTLPEACALAATVCKEKFDEFHKEKMAYLTAAMVESNGALNPDISVY